MKNGISIALKTTLAAAAIALLAGCPSSKMARDQDKTLEKYGELVRWGQWDAAASFLAPEYLEENPLTRLDLDRLQLFRVTAYLPRQTAYRADGLAVSQVVEIRMFNTREAVERAIIDTQEWRWNPESEQWKLHSGLPDVTRGY